MSEQRCLSGKHCINRTSAGPVATTNRPLCEGCITNIQDAVNQLPDYQLMLANFKDYKPNTVGQAKVSGGNSEGESPLNVAVVDLIDAIDDVLADFGGVQVRDLITHNGGVDVALRANRLYVQAAAMCGHG